MRRKAAALAAVALSLVLGGCNGFNAFNAPERRVAPPWRPLPVAGAREPADIIAASTAAEWRAIDPQNIMVVEFADGQSAFIELAPDFAPVHVANIRSLARSGWWSGASLYRVQDNYVSQWGHGDVEKPMPSDVVATPPAEYDRELAGLNVRPLGYPDPYAPMAGHAFGWPIGYDPDSNRAWLTHCYGSIGVARGLAPDTGTGGELYAVIGHMPRQLDLNIAVVGRVIEGMSALSARPRGTGNLGFYQAERGETPAQISRVRLASDMPLAERPAFEVLRTDSSAFDFYVTGRANRGGAFFQRSAGGVDVCNAQVPVRRRQG